MENNYTKDYAIDQKMNIGSAKELARLLLVNTPDKVDVPCIAHALEKLLEPVENFLERLGEA